MNKIIRTSLKIDYIPLNTDALQLDSTIDFDCYIKRFNGYVIIIEKGTEITPELLSKIDKAGNLYVHEDELELYKSYCKRYGVDEKRVLEETPRPETVMTLDQIITNINALPLQIQESENAQDKLSLVYKNACYLMKVFFNDRDIELPIDSLELLIDVILRLVVRPETSLVNFTKMMPLTYKVECHSVNVAILSIFLGRKSGMQRTDLQQLALAAILHDIGKVSIETSILEKKGRLDDTEFEEVQEHSKFSVEVASKNMIRSKRILDAILYHHERLDGTGYPEGLIGERIPRFAKIIGICDVFDALTTEKTYRKRYSSYDALMLMSHEMSGQFDQDYIKELIQLLHK